MNIHPLIPIRPFVSVSESSENRLRIQQAHSDVAHMLLKNNLVHPWPVTQYMNLDLLFSVLHHCLESISAGKVWLWCLQYHRSISELQHWHHFCLSNHILVCRSIHWHVTTNDKSQIVPFNWWYWWWHYVHVYSLEWTLSMFLERCLISLWAIPILNHTCRTLLIRVKDSFDNCSILLILHVLLYHALNCLYWTMTKLQMP